MYNKIRQLQVSPNGKFVFCSEHSDFTLWNLETLKSTPISLYAMYDAMPVEVKFSPDSRKLVVRLSDKTLRVWDVETGREIKFANGLIGDPVQDVNIDFLNKGQVLVIAGYKNNGPWTIKPGRDGTEDEMYINPYDKVDPGHYQQLRLINLDTGKTRVLKVGEMGVRNITSFTASQDGSNQIWIETGMELFTCGITHLFPDQLLLAIVKWILL